MDANQYDKETTHTTPERDGVDTMPQRSMPQQQRGLDPASMAIIGVLMAASFYAGTQFSTAPQHTGANPPGGTATIDDVPADLKNVFSIRDTDVVRGNANADIILIEYSDFECPFCQRFHATAQQAVDEKGIAWVYRHLPLSFHPTADEAAVIAECVRAAEGGEAFWKYTDMLFSLSVSGIAAYRDLGKVQGLTEAQLDACLAADSSAQLLVAGHIREASSLGIDGTPGNLLYNKKNKKIVRVPGAVPYDVLAQSIDSIQR